MRVAVDYPPLYEEIAAAFDIANRNVLFAWGETIYNPKDFDIAPELLAHEQVHAQRQGDDIEGWWRRYIDEPEFRFAEEVPAHIVEYQTLIANAGNNRKARRRYLAYVAKRLASPLYGGLITASEAKKQIQLAERALREGA